MLSAQRLSLYHEVVRRGSLAAAARALSFTQSAVSQQIAALEREAGVPLLERSHRGTRPTAAGRVLARHADRIVAQLREAERDLEAAAVGNAGDVRVAAFPTAAVALVTGTIAELEKREPRIDVTLTEADPDESRSLLRAGDIDLALDFDYDLLPSELGNEFIVSPLLSEHLLVALPANNPYARRRRLRLADLRDEQWIGGDYGCSDILRAVCAQAGFTPTLVFECNDYAIAQGLIASAVGIALVPELAVANLRSDVVARPLADVRARRRIRALLRADAYRIPAVDCVLALLSEQAANDSFANRWRNRIQALPDRDGTSDAAAVNASGERRAAPGLVDAAGDDTVSAAG
jgi:DNA-binding transcriptional LysR family regulator